MKVILKDSKIGGKGVFAARDFKKGETVIVWHPKVVVTKDTMRFLSQNDQNHTTYIGKGKYFVMGPIARFINHSCEPNTYVKNKKDVALRRIKQGEEITSDYALNGFDEWVLKCQCKAKHCRKIVYGDFRKLDAKSKKRLYPYLEGWFKKELKIKN